MTTNITLNGITYAPVPVAAPGTRAVVVVDRGWIFAGNVVKDTSGMLTLSDAVHVFRWESIGFHGMLADPKNSKVTLKPMPFPVEIPAGSVIFQVPVTDNWGE